MSTLGDNFVPPLTPGSYRSSPVNYPRGRSGSHGVSTLGARSVSPSQSRAYSLVETEEYRRQSLAFNNAIVLSPANQPLPANVQSLIGKVLATCPNGPAYMGPEIELLENDFFRPMEASIRVAFDKHVFIANNGHVHRSDDQPMRRQVVPTKMMMERLGMLSAEESDKHRISTPTPDILYGYATDAFSLAHRRQMINSLGDMEFPNHVRLQMPFLLVEFKGDAGDMWTCTNQCLGGSASCVNIGERLNQAVSTRDLTPFNSAMFSIAFNGFDARLYVTWRHISTGPNDKFGTGYRMQRVKAFQLLLPKHYAEFKDCVRNIIAWGTGDRFEEIGNALDKLSAKRRRI